MIYPRDDQNVNLAEHFHEHLLSDPVDELDPPAESPFEIGLEVPVPVGKSDDLQSDIRITDVIKRLDQVSHAPPSSKIPRGPEGKVGLLGHGTERKKIEVHTIANDAHSISGKPFGQECFPVRAPHRDHMIRAGQGHPRNHPHAWRGCLLPATGLDLVIGGGLDSGIAVDIVDNRAPQKGFTDEERLSGLFPAGVDEIVFPEHPQPGKHQYRYRCPDIQQGRIVGKEEIALDRSVLQALGELSDTVGVREGIPRTMTRDNKTPEVHVLPRVVPHDRSARNSSIISAILFAEWPSPNGFSRAIMFR